MEPGKQEEVKKQIQSERDRSEVKIMPVNNGWMLKSRAGWFAYTDLEVLMEAVREVITHEGGISHPLREQR